MRGSVTHQVSPIILTWQGVNNIFANPRRHPPKCNMRPKPVPTPVKPRLMVSPPYPIFSKPVTDWVVFIHWHVKFQRQRIGQANTSCRKLCGQQKNKRVHPQTHRRIRTESQHNSESTDREVSLFRRCAAQSFVVTPTCV